MESVPYQSRGLRYPNTVVVVVSTNHEYRKRVKPFIEREIGYAVVILENTYEAIHVIGTEFELTPVILIAEQNANPDYGGVHLIGHVEEQRIFPIASILVHDCHDEGIFESAKKAGAVECFPLKGLPQGVPAYNLGRSFRQSIIGCERFLRLQFMEQLECMLSDTDKGVFIYNKRGALKRWKHTWQDAQRTEQLPAFVFMDLVGFGRANNEEHDDGDRLLEQMAEVLCHNLRPSDYIIRYGGDEFILVLPKTTVFDARYHVVPRLHVQLRSFHFKLSSGKEFPVVFRSGVSAPTRQQLSMDSLEIYVLLKKWANKIERRKKAKQARQALAQSKI